MGWLERKNTEMINSSALPSIETGTQRRRQIGQGFVGGSSKAAGFNRNDFNMTGEVTMKRKGVSEITANAGVGLSSAAAQKKEDDNKPPLYIPT